jgi:hypothetical protein
MVMKKILAFVVLALANLVTAGYASAQAGGVQATVPFSFTFADRSMPAGTYLITPVSSAVIMIRNKSNPGIAALGMSTHNYPAVDSDRKLVFHKYGEQYFLSQVLCGDCLVSVDLPKSKREKRASLREAQLEAPQQVLLALR